MAGDASTTRLTAQAPHALLCCLSQLLDTQLTVGARNGVFAVNGWTMRANRLDCELFLSHTYTVL